MLVCRVRLQAFTRSLDRHTTLVGLTVWDLLLYLLGSGGDDAGAAAKTLLAVSLIVERTRSAVADHRVLRLVRDVGQQPEALREGRLRSGCCPTCASGLSRQRAVHVERLRHAPQVVRLLAHTKLRHNQHTH